MATCGIQEQPVCSLLSATIWPLVWRPNAEQHDHVHCEQSVPLTRLRWLQAIGFLDPCYAMWRRYLMALQPSTLPTTWVGSTSPINGIGDTWIACGNHSCDSTQQHILGKCMVLLVPGSELS